MPAINTVALVVLSACNAACAPAVKPTQAIKRFSPKSVNIHWAPPGIWPNVGWIERSHPKNRPDTSTPPHTPSVIGMPIIGIAKSPMSVPSTQPMPTVIRSVTMVERSG